MAVKPTKWKLYFIPQLFKISNMADRVFKVGHTIKNWLCYNFAFCKAALFILGLISSHSIVENAVVVVFMTYLMREWKEDLQKSAATVNINQGLTSIITLACAHITNTYIGGFKMILLSTSAYITGLILLCLSYLKLLPHTKVCLFYIAVTMIALGKAGRNSSLKTFLADQFRAEYRDRDGARVESHRKMWWRLAWFTGMVVASSALPSDNAHWSQIFELSAYALVAGFVVFLFGIPVYHYHTPSRIERSPIVVIYRVFKVALVNRNLDYPIDKGQFYGTNHSSSLSQTNHFRWLNRAAIIEVSCVINPEEEEQKGRLCTVTQVEETKLLIGMVPMWMTFLVYSLVKSTGENFFTVQGLHMNGNGNGKEIVFLGLIKYLVSLTISFLWESILSKKVDETHKRTALLARIGIGMLSSLCCCTIAWRVEAHRLSLVQHCGVVKMPIAKMPMTFTWLVPQYCLLGLMEGLAEDGLKEFFCLQVRDRMEEYGPLLNHFVFGIGNLLSALSTCASRRWFSHHLNKSHLDKYYQMLAVLSYLNLGCYWYVSHLYTCKKLQQDRFNWR